MLNLVGHLENHNQCKQCKNSLPPGLVSLSPASWVG